MIEFTGHRLDAVVVLTVDDDEIVAAAAAAGPGRGPRRRHRGGHPAPAGGVRRADRAADRRLPRARHPARGRRHGRGRRRHPADLRRARRRPASRRQPDRWASATAGSRSRRPSRSRACARPGWSSARPSSCCGRGRRAGITHRRAGRDRRGQHPLLGRDAVVQGLPPAFPGIDLRVGQRRGGARHPRRPRAGRGRRRLDRLRGDRRRLARRRGDHGGGRRRTGRGRRADARSTEEALWRGIAAARLGGRVTDISHAVETHVRASGGYGILEDYVGHGIGSEMHQPPNVPNFGRPGRGPKLVRGLALAVEPMVTLGRKQTRLLDDDWTVVTERRQLGGALRAHVHADPRRRLGAHRPRRRRAGAGRPRRPVRRSLTRPAITSRTDGRRAGHGTMSSRRGVFPRDGVVSTARIQVRARCRWSGRRAPERKRPPEERPRRRSVVGRRQPQLRRREFV